MRNRYDGVLEKHNQAICHVGGQPNRALAHVAALALVAKLPTGSLMLDIGCGEGDSALPFLLRTRVRMVLLDASPRMLVKMRDALKAYSHRIQPICDDALHHLDGSKGKYRVIHGSHVFHNFTAAEREVLFAAVHAALVPDGVFILDDVIPETDDAVDSVLLKRQLKRYQLLPKDVAGAIIEHVSEDAKAPYRMNEHDLVPALLRAGFVEGAVVDRIEREGLGFAKK